MVVVRSGAFWHCKRGWHWDLVQRRKDSALVPQSGIRKDTNLLVEVTDLGQKCKGFGWFWLVSEHTSGTYALTAVLSKMPSKGCTAVAQRPGRI